MKKIILSGMLLCAVTIGFAQDTTPVKEADPKQEHILMHESMMKAHQQAAECLKSGKSEDECRNAFHETCKGISGPDKCGPWMRQHKMNRKNK